MDKINIKNLEVFANHGVFPEENALGQKFLLSAVLYTETRKAGLTDDLTASIHYGEVSQTMKHFVETHTFKLLETVAEKLAFELLTGFPRLQRVELEIKKPWAPVGLPLETVSVEIARGWHRAYIALGSNMGDKEAYLRQAAAALAADENCQVEKVSAFLTTPPYGYTDQDEFLNGCLALRTLLEPGELLSLLHEIEQAADRKREIRWGPRTLDLDILLYDDLVLDTEELQIPHIEMHKRDFVLRPMAEIAPFVRHPVLKKTVREMLEELDI
ncbi:2-amino-4-hydroxy-6-hydroxymethyldihydropteridine diphosphokinase [Anaerovorax odorimutans]|uniref:Bifunctional folate synthesis protein n=1 Tax=Anaerovorax odorimutans TaxID=109327 RepID=A0ABT1RRJ0_9FIRM|nr:2-amino-4-hydroxy-6-hydroxymethyldihydropteridine diphosphokinase [Anaerovorax odorimutans]MCQ4637822.1 2-amino-4-hydroxy-6-hydroxymethyldihydropteridine diphosphokinase [Anaerovorax odorimutans]